MKASAMGMSTRRRTNYHCPTSSAKDPARSKCPVSGRARQTSHQLCLTQPAFAHRRRRRELRHGSDRSYPRLLQIVLNASLECTVHPINGKMLVHYAIHPSIIVPEVFSVQRHRSSFYNPVSLFSLCLPFASSSLLLQVDAHPLSPQTPKDSPIFLPTDVNLAQNESQQGRETRRWHVDW